MKTFKEFVATDSHNHPNFDKQYACYMAYVGRQQNVGDRLARNYEFDYKLLKNEYNSLKMDGTISISRDSASKIIDVSLQQYTSGESSAPAYNSLLVPTAASSSSALATAQSFASDEETLDHEHETPGITTSTQQIPEQGTEAKTPSIDDVASDEESVCKELYYKEPECNIRNKNEREQVGDFAISEKMEQEKLELMLCVTPPYRPPVPSDTESELGSARNPKLGKHRLDQHDDNIMDMTSASAFVMSMSDETYTEAMEDMPTLDFGLEEIKELKIIMEPECSFEELRDRVYGIPLNTPVRRYLYVPELEEKQGMFDVICPFVRGALRVFGVPSNISEIAIVATGERRNFDQKYEDRLQNCKRADIVAADKDGIQIFLAECAMLHETDARKFTEDRWKVARCMKDIWDFGVRRTTQAQSPHENFSTFGLHSFGRELHFLQLDFRSSYRLWEIETCLVPLELAGFWKKMMTCCETSLAFAEAVSIEVERRKTQEKLSQKQRLSLIRAANNIPRTTVSPPKPKIKK
ncbi:hypothetical protein BGX21_008750 [Mortierella sp. AD011]|nr:hypothetical protein BGX21_008750 [Mortierella sp. AD011]